MSTGLYSGASGLALGVGLYAGNPGLWGGAPGLITGDVASLYLDFLAGAPLDSRITFTRGTNATLVDSTGKIVYAPANLLLRSEEFDNASWVKNAVTVTANTTVAPDGTSTADTFTESTTNDIHIAYQTNTLSALTTHTLSTYVKAGTRSFAMLRVGGGGFAVGPAIKASLTGAGTTTTLEGPVSSSAITSVGNGWYRVSMTFASTATTAGYTPQVGPHDNGTSLTYLGDGSTVFIWGAQLEQVTYQTTPATYVATTTSAYYGPRFDYDPVTLAAKGLLIEEARTNLLLYSQDWNTAAWSKPSVTVTNNSITAPDGTLTGNKLLTSGATTITQASSSTATSQTFSVYVKLGSSATAANNFIVRNSTTAVNLLGVAINYTTGAIVYTVGSSGASVVAVGNGWWRLTLSVTSGITIGNTLIVYTGFTGGGVNGDFLYAWGAQLEAGAFATSYTPTVASTVTRSADIASMTGTNFSSWYNQSEGTFVAVFDRIATNTVTFSGGQPRVFRAVDAGTNFIIAGGDSGLGEKMLVRSGGSDVANITSGVQIAANTVGKMAAAYAVNNFGLSVDGGAVGTDTSGAAPTGINTLYLGDGSTATRALNGHIRFITYYNTRLPNATLQALTA